MLSAGAFLVFPIRRAFESIDEMWCREQIRDVNFHDSCLHIEKVDANSALRGKGKKTINSHLLWSFCHPCWPVGLCVLPVLTDDLMNIGGSLKCSCSGQYENIGNCWDLLQWRIPEWNRSIPCVAFKATCSSIGSLSSLKLCLLAPCIFQENIRDAVCLLKL